MSAPEDDSPSAPPVLCTSDGDLIALRGSGERAGRHVVCGGDVLNIRTTSTLRALVCSRCFLRVTMPCSLVTEADICAYFAQRFSFARKALAATPPG